jgi:tetratricopeptide (TPR) repeat protein
MYVLAFLKNDGNGMKQQADWVVGKPFEPTLATWLATTQFSAGHLNEARLSQQKGIDLALRKNQQDVAARLRAHSAWLELLVGNCKGAVDDTKASLAQFRGSNQLSSGAVVFSFCGNASEADSLVKELKARYPNDTASARVMLPIAEAIMEMNKNNLSRTIEILEPVRRYELGEFGELWPNYFRGLAYLKLGQPKNAVAEFQKILDHPAIAFFSALQPIGQLYLARAWAQQARGGNPGNNVGPFSDTNALGSARKAYQDFLAASKDADSDNPLFQQAKAEYARLSTQ